MSAVQPPEELESAAEELFWAGDFDRSIALYERAYALFRKQGNARRAGSTALNLTVVYGGRGHNAVAAGWYQKATGLLADAPDCEERAWLVALGALASYYVTGDADRALRVCEEAHRIAVAAGSRDMQAYTSAYRGFIIATRGDVADGVQLIDEAMTAAVTGELTRYAAANCFCIMLSACQSLGDFGRASQWIEQARRCTYDGALMGFPGNCRVQRAEMLRMQGLWDEALQEAEQAREETQDWAQQPGDAEFEVGMLKLYVGDLDDAEEAFQRAHARGREPQPGLSLITMARGNTEAAARAIATSVIVTARRDMTHSMLLEIDPETVRRSELLAAAVEITSAAGQVDTAEMAVSELHALERRSPWPVVRARVAYALGALALAREKPSDALFVLTSALELWREVGAPYELARTRCLLAQAYTAVGDASRAALELQAARDEFVRLGAVVDARKVTAMPDAQAAPGSPLTPREIEVLRLVANGGTNKEIAAQLVVSVTTIERHVANIYRKIGVRSRVEAAMYARERGLARSTTT